MKRELKPGDKVEVYFKDIDGWVKKKIGFVSLYIEPDPEDFFDQYGYVKVVDENKNIIFSGTAQPDDVWKIR